MGVALQLPNAKNRSILDHCSSALDRVSFDLIKYAHHLGDFFCLGLVRCEERDQVLCGNDCKWVIRVDESEVLLSMDLLCITQVGNQVTQLVELGVVLRDIVANALAVGKHLPPPCGGCFQRSKRLCQFLDELSAVAMVLPDEVEA